MQEAGQPVAEVVPPEQPGGGQGIVAQAGEILELGLEAGVLPDLAALALQGGIGGGGHVVMPQQRHVNVQFPPEGIGGFPADGVDGTPLRQVVVKQAVNRQGLLIVDVVVDFVRHMLYPNPVPSLLPEVGGQGGKQLMVEGLHRGIAGRLPYAG